ncbi:MAG: LacI family DNA-binding transcriptional regulator [Propionibacteriaceae bacterium]|nr:LacI family DNA-binding transcriptional regulator [Propionibacteriaceae bacterium]
MARDGFVDHRRVTIRDVASRAGVAISSVSAALNDRPGVSDATRDRIRAVAAELGFVASLRARSLPSKRAFAIGLVIHRSAGVLEADPFFGAFIAGVERAAAARGHAVVLQIAEDEAEEIRRYRELAASHRVDGVILNETTDPDPRVELVQELGLAAVGVNTAADFPFPAVRQWSAPGVAEIVNHLIGLGHRGIAHVSGPLSYVHTRERMASWRSTLSAAGLDPGPVFPGDFTYEAGRAAAEAWLALRLRPTAVMCVTDLCAIGFMLRLQDAGVAVPGEVSVAGFDGIAMGTYVRPNLTTVRVTPRLLGEATATLLLDALGSPGERPPDVELAPGALVVRESTAAAPG